jgi:hypothetical protein
VHFAAQADGGLSDSDDSRFASGELVIILSKNIEMQDFDLISILYR